MLKIKWVYMCLALGIALLGCGKQEQLEKVADGPMAKGNESSGGGDAYAREFVSIGYKLVDDLREQPISVIDSAKLYDAVRTTHIESKEQLVLDGHEIGAINYPKEKRIEVSRKHWDQITSEPFRKELLVLHEYFGILGIDDQDYKISGLMDRGRVCGRTPVVRYAIEKHLKRQCFKISFYDLQFVYSINIVNRELDVEKLKASDFEGLSNVITLTLNLKSLGTIEEGSFTHLPKVDKVEIALQDGKNFVLPFRIFNGLGNAKVLNDLWLFFDGVPSLEKRHFEGLGSKIKKLTVRVTKTKLEPEVFSLIPETMESAEVQMEKNFELTPEMLRGMPFRSLLLQYETPLSTNLINEVAQAKNLKEVIMRSYSLPVSSCNSLLQLEG